MAKIIETIRFAVKFFNLNAAPKRLIMRTILLEEKIKKLP